MGEPILGLRGITKIYPNGVVANQDVSLDIAPKTIHAIVGENGAGKTTLMKVVFGISEPLRGTIIYHGRPIKIRSSHEAIQLGIGMVHQHLMLAAELSIAENMVMGVEPRKWKLFYDRAAAHQIARQVSQRFKMEVPVEHRVADVPIGVRQRVEILKALYRNAELVILDEPTSVLTFQETEALFATLRELTRHGKTIIFISHKLSEVKGLADYITIMRDGRVVTTQAANTLSEEEIATMMVGRPIASGRVHQPTRIGDELLRVEGLCQRNSEGVEVLKDISFAVRAGEIVGVAGVEGNGQSELVRLLTAITPIKQGDVRLRGESIVGKTPRQVRALGLCHIPEDRLENGVAEEASVEENLIVDRYRDYSRHTLLRRMAIREHANTLIADFDIRVQSPTTAVAALSGGNIQKVVVARELSTSADIVVAAQPTRGIDVGAELAVHSLLCEARDKGRAIFMVSADIDEILKLSTRIIVLYGGRIVARFDNDHTLTAEQLGPYMLGVDSLE